MYNRLFTFGCSYTSFLWKTWADIIADDLQIPLQNWGQSGIGNIAIASKILECDLTHKFTKDDLIIVNWSSWHRIDLVNQNRNWHNGGNAFNNPMFPPKYLKRYWNQNNDIVKNSTAIILTNRNTNIAYQSHMIDYEGRTEYNETSYDFTHYTYLLDNLPKKNIFDNSNNTQFSNTIIDHHPDILTHLAHVQQIYKHLNLKINSSTIKKYSDMQDTIINTVNDKHQKPIHGWEKMVKLFEGLAL